MIKNRLLQFARGDFLLCGVVVLLNKNDVVVSSQLS